MFLLDILAVFNFHLYLDTKFYLDYGNLNYIMV